MAHKVIVTGANGGLGSAVTKKLLNEGYEVYGTIIPGDEDTDIIKNSFNNHAKLNLTKVDALNEREVENYISGLENISGAVLTAGGFMMKPFRETTEKDLDKMIDINFKTAFNFARPITEQLKKNREGRIFFISSKPAVEKGGNALTSYSVSKHMLLKLAEIVNEDLKGTRASAAIIAPDMIDTQANRKAMPDADHNAWITPQEIAETIAFYLSENAERIREPVLKMYGS